MKSLLESVVRKSIDEDSKESFISKVAKESGISSSKLSKVYSRGYAAGESNGKNPVSWAKGRVYSYIKGSKKHDTDLREEDDTDEYKDYLVNKLTKHDVSMESILSQTIELEEKGHKDAKSWRSAYEQLVHLDSSDEDIIVDEDDDDMPPVMRIWDSRDKVWVGKPSRSPRRLRNRADKLDLEYGAVRFNVRAYEEGS
jgi:predicted transcriptional regulator